MNLAPLAIQKFFDNAGRPLSGGLLFTYVTGTNTKLATYVDASGSVQNTNPIRLDFRGEARVWLNGTLTYRFVLAPESDTDPPTAPIWSVDDVRSIVTFENLTQQIIGQILYPRTAAEIAGGVVPINYGYPPGRQARYNTIQDAFTQWGQTGGVPVFSDLGGIALTGSIGGSNVGRPDAQLVIRNSGVGAGHALIEIWNIDPADEGGVTFDSILSNGNAIQHCGHYARFVNGINTVGAFHSVVGMHMPETGTDFNLFGIWSNNSMRLLGPSVGIAPWNDMPPVGWVDVFSSLKARTSLVVGDHAYSVAAAAIACEISGYLQVGDIDGAKITDHAVLIGYDTGNAYGFVQGFRNSTAALMPLAILGSALRLGGASGTHTTPLLDNNMNLGSGALRFKEIFAAVGAINTSDATQKTLRGDGSPTPEEIAWGRELAKLMRAYRWNDALAQKGDGARIHFGAIAQEVEAAGHAAGVANPLAYGFLCRDPAMISVKKRVPVERQAEESFDESITRVEMRDGKAVRITETVTRKRPAYRDEPLFDELGEPIMAEHEKKITQVTERMPVMETIEQEIESLEPVLDEQGNPAWQYGIRYTELFAFILATS